MTSTATDDRTASRPAPSVAPASARATALAGGLHPIGVFILLAGAFLPIMDFFITNVALPSIDASLHVLGGRLGDRYGRHRMFLSALVGFVLASLACGLAPSVGVLIAARIVQGGAAALLILQVLATFHHTLEH